MTKHTGYVAKEAQLDLIAQGKKWRVMLPVMGNGPDYAPTAYECAGTYRTKREADAALRTTIARTREIVAAFNAMFAAS